MWLYAVRTSRDVLPTRYRSRTIHLRRVPRLPPHGFDEVHLILMRELMAAPATLEGLVERTGLPARQVAQHVAALFFAGGLTTDPRSAQLAEARVRQDWLALQLAPDGFATDGRPASAVHGPASEFGVPSSLLRDSAPAPLQT
jgi:hypothetical protein